MGFTSWIRSYARRRLTSNISLSGLTPAGSTPYIFDSGLWCAA